MFRKTQSSTGKSDVFSWGGKGSAHHSANKSPHVNNCLFHKEIDCFGVCFRAEHFGVCPTPSNVVATVE